MASEFIDPKRIFAGAHDQQVCIVMFKSDTTKDQMADYLNHVQENGATIKHFYESIKGVALEMDSCEASFVKDPIVESIEPDGTVSTSSKFRF